MLNQEVIDFCQSNRCMLKLVYSPCFGGTYNAVIKQVIDIDTGISASIRGNNISIGKEEEIEIGRCTDADCNKAIELAISRAKTRLLEIKYA